MLNGFVQYIIDAMCCRWKKGMKYDEAVSTLPSDPVAQRSPLLTTDVTASSLNNPLTSPQGVSLLPQQ